MGGAFSPFPIRKDVNALPGGLRCQCCAYSWELPFLCLTHPFFLGDALVLINYVIHVYVARVKPRRGSARLCVLCLKQYQGKFTVPHAVIPSVIRAFQPHRGALKCPWNALAVRG